MFSAGYSSDPIFYLSSKNFRFTLVPFWKITGNMWLMTLNLMIVLRVFVFRFILLHLFSLVLILNFIYLSVRDFRFNWNLLLEVTEICWKAEAVKSVVKESNFLDFLVL